MEEQTKRKSTGKEKRKAAVTCAAVLTEPVVDSQEFST